MLNRRTHRGPGLPGQGSTQGIPCLARMPGLPNRPGPPFRSHPGSKGTSLHGSRVDLILSIHYPGGDDMTMPGFITGQPLNGRQVGNGIFQFLPCLPHEGPPGMPRVMARQLFPQGFLRPQPAAVAPPAAMAPPVTLIPPAVPAPAVRRQPLPAAPPAPRKRVLERGTFPSWV